MKIVVFRRTVLARCVCPVCHEPARPYPPHRWAPANGPRPAWSHVDGEPLCPMVGPDGYRPAPSPSLVAALWVAHVRCPFRTAATRQTFAPVVRVVTR